MKVSKKRMAIIFSMVIVVFLLFSCAVMKAKAEDLVTAEVTIYFVENINDTSATIGNAFKEVSIIKNVNEADGSTTYSGTIDVSDVAYRNDDAPDDIRSIFGWYDSNKQPIQLPYSFENLSLSDANGVVEIKLYAECSKTVRLIFNSNHVNYGGTYADIIEAYKYYPQSTASETSKTITLPSNPQSELSINIDGYTFKGWAIRESGDVEIVTSTTVSYDNNTGDKRYYAHWQDQRPVGNTVTDAGQCYLDAGKKYTLGDGTWTVNGGATNYPGGTTFYVTKSETYTFSK